MSDLIASLGGPAAVARLLGIKTPSVIGWRGTPPAERCPDIERAHYPQWSVEQLRPDVAWQRVPDADWPHPGGRPCLDVARPVAQSTPTEPQSAQEGA